MIKNKDDNEHCGICKIDYFERNNFFYGKLMTVRDFFAEQCYFNEKRWLINKATIGYGVVCGLEVVEIEGNTNKVKVMPGMAIDGLGREILVCDENEVDLVPEEDECRDPQENGNKYLICIEFKDCKTEPLPLPPISCDQEERCEYNRIRDSFKIRVLCYQEEEPGISQPKTYCPLDEKFDPPENGETGEEGAPEDIQDEEPGEESNEVEGKTLQQYLCEQISSGCPDYSQSTCVHLATVTAAIEDSDTYKVKSDDIDICSDNRRKLVYSNALLYDLIHCFHGDLPHITNINWWPYHGKEDVKWQSFSDLVTNGFTVTFDKEMELDTINRYTFLFAVITTGSKAGYRKREYIYPELVEILVEDKKTFTITIMPDNKWIKDEVEEGGYSMLRNEKEAGFDVEIILRGSHIMSAGEDNKKALDGDFIDGKLPSGNGAQGGDFVSWFHVLLSEQDVSTPGRRRIKSKKIDKQKEE